MIILGKNPQQNEICKMLCYNELIQSMVRSMAKPREGRIFLKVHRTALIGSILLDEGLERKDFDIFEEESLAALTDLYIFYVRSLYDMLMGFLREHYGDNKLPKSFNDFVKKIKKQSNTYPHVRKKLKDVVSLDRFGFNELRDIRNSIKEGTSMTALYIKNEKIYLWVSSLKNKTKKSVDEELSHFIFRTSFSLWYMMTMVYMEINKKDWKSL